MRRNPLLETHLRWHTDLTNSYSCTGMIAPVSRLTLEHLVWNIWRSVHIFDILVSLLPIHMGRLWLGRKVVSQNGTRACHSLFPEWNLEAYILRSYVKNLLCSAVRRGTVPGLRYFLSELKP